MKYLTIPVAILAVFYFGSIVFVESVKTSNKDDINAEIKKFQDKLEAFEKPSPEVIKSVIEQVQNECKNKTTRTIDEHVAKNMSTCVEGLFNQTELQIEFQNAIPVGALDEVFKKVCLKWPKVKVCMKEGFDLIEECFAKGNLVTKGMDGMVEFFCGADNDGSLIALFLAEGGLHCLEQQGDAVRDCINENNTEENQEDLCKAVDSVTKCTSFFKKCSDPTPENLISSMLRQVQKVMNCTVTSEPLKRSSDSISISAHSTLHLLILLALSYLIIL